LLELSSTARLYGDIHTKELKIDQGARFIGKSTFEEAVPDAPGSMPSAPLSGKNSANEN
jgi:cytoskeletal protein CcmA (bactofilin family)